MKPAVFLEHTADTLEYVEGCVGEGEALCGFHSGNCLPPKKGWQAKPALRSKVMNIRFPNPSAFCFLWLLPHSKEWGIFFVIFRFYGKEIQKFLKFCGKSHGCICEVDKYPRIRKKCLSTRNFFRDTY